MLQVLEFGSDSEHYLLGDKSQQHGGPLGLVFLVNVTIEVWEPSLPFQISWHYIVQCMSLVFHLLGMY